MTKTLAALAAILMAGCASAPPTNPGNPQADFNADRWDCQKQVAAMPAPRPVQVPPERTDTVTQCEPSPISQGVVCRSSQQPAMGGGMAATEAMFRTHALLAAQQAADAPREALIACLKAKGWR